MIGVWIASAQILIPGDGGAVVQGRMFFFEKNNQKTFAPCGRSRIVPRVPDSASNLQKFFGSFFQKRTTS
jgi:hypothetical protein